MIKVNLLLACASLALFTGCVSHENIVFSDEADVRAAAQAAAPRSPAQKHIEKADERQIEQLIYGYLLERHFWDAADYTAIFLQADDAQIADLIKKYPQHVPPIKPSYHAELQSHRTPLDKDTNKPAMILSADVNEPNPDGTVDAIGRWYAGDAVTGFRAFQFKKVDGQWQVADVK